MFIEFVFLHYLVMSDHYLQGERKTISVNYLLILKYWWALPKSNELSAGEPGGHAQHSQEKGRGLRKQSKWLNRGLKAAIRKGSFNTEMAQASSNCLYLSKCGITKGYLLQSKGALQLAQKPLKKSNSYKVLLTSEAVKFGQTPKLPLNAFITKG